MRGLAAGAAMSRHVDPLLSASAAASALATAAALAAEHWWIFELFSHFPMQYLLGQCALLALLLARRRYRAALLLVPFAMLNAVPLLPYLAAAPEPPAGGEPLTVVSVNVNGRNTAYQALIDIVARASPDLLLLVEYSDDWADAMEPLRRRYPFKVEMPMRDNFGLALLSRLPLEQTRRVDLETTPALEAHVRAGDRLFRVIGVHLRPPVTRRLAAERNRQLEQLADLARTDDAPLLIMGDFNITPFSPFFRRWLARTGLRDARLGHGFGFTWPASLPLLGIPIDHCAVSEEFSVLEYRSLQSFGSDHYPVLAELRLKAAR